MLKEVIIFVTTGFISFGGSRWLERKDCPFWFTLLAGLVIVTVWMIWVVSGIHLCVEAMKWLLARLASY